MRKPIMALLATTAIVFAACGGAASAAPTDAPVVTPAPVITPQPVAEVELFNSEYASKVEAGTDGGTLVITTNRVELNSTLI